MAVITYFTYFFAGGQTLGMKAMNIRLCGADGSSQIGYTRGFLRYVGTFISYIAFGLGYFWILIDDKKQGWHDKIADTLVVYDK